MSSSTPLPPTPSLFSPAPQQKSSTPLLAWAIAGAVILVIVAGLLLASRHHAASHANELLPLHPYAANLVFSGLQMSESTSLSGGKSTFIDPASTPLSRPSSKPSRSLLSAPTTPTWIPSRSAPPLSRRMTTASSASSSKTFRPIGASNSPRSTWFRSPPARSRSVKTSHYIRTFLPESSPDVNPDCCNLSVISVCNFGPNLASVMATAQTRSLPRALRGYKHHQDK